MKRYWYRCKRMLLRPFGVDIAEGSPAGEVFSWASTRGQILMIQLKMIGLVLLMAFLIVGYLAFLKFLLF